MPWVLFTLIAQHGWLQAAPVAAPALLVAIVLPSALARRPKVLEIGAVVAFIGLTAIAFGDPAAGNWARRATPISSTGAGVIIRWVASS